MQERETIAALYQAAGYRREDLGRTDALVFTDAAGGRPPVAIYFPLAAATPPDANRALQDLAALQAQAPGAILVVAMDNVSRLISSLGKDFPDAAKAAGAVLRTYTGVLDSVYGGGDIGLRGGETAEQKRLRDQLMKYGRVNPDILSAVLRSDNRIKDAALVAPPTRVRQRFHRRDGLRPSDRAPNAGEDLLAHFVTRLAQPASGPEVFLVIGPGGAGKSFFFEALFTYLEEAFQNAKQRNQLSTRPVPVTPESFRKNERRDVQLFDAIARTEYGQIGGVDLLAHQVNTGANLLMFDGLDEFFAGSEDLSEEIARRFLVEGAKGRLVIVLRDSLLDTSEPLRTLATRFAERLGAGFSIYEIALWDDGDGAAQRELAWLKLEGRRPAHAEADTERVAGFLDLLRTSGPRVRELCQLAFYCDLTLQLYADNLAGATHHSASRTALPQDEYDLLELCFDGMLDRELDKIRYDTVDDLDRALGGEDPEASLQAELARRAMAAPTTGMDGASYAASLDRLFQIQSSAGAADGDRSGVRAALSDLVEEAAWAHRRGGDGAGGGAALNADTLAQLYDDAVLWSDEEARSLGHRILRQFVLFQQGETDGSVGFTHDFMADYLAARYIARMAETGQAPRAALMGAPIHGETEIFQGYLERTA
ncbi:MAG: hypothetical protein AAF909_07105 [Pseudomonadota bacterium]